jgi:hypothetical protein
MAVDPLTGKPPIPFSWLFAVDLPSGIYSAREIFDFCCAANPTKAFLIRPLSTRPQSRLVISLQSLVYRNPLGPPRVEAVKFWEFQIGKSTNGIPSLEEIRMAMCDPKPEKRSAASMFVEASLMNYTPLDLIGKAEGSDQAVWTALGVKDALFRDADANFFGRVIPRIPRLQEDLKQIESPILALLASLQLTREKQDTSQLDEVVGKHTFSEAEINAIKPELDRMARSSKAVRDKLTQMKSQISELSPEHLAELEQTNFFTLVPTGAN